MILCSDCRAKITKKNNVVGLIYRLDDRVWSNSGGAFVTQCCTCEYVVDKSHYKFFKVK